MSDIKLSPRALLWLRELVEFDLHVLSPVDFDLPGYRRVEEKKKPVRRFFPSDVFKELHGRGLLGWDLCYYTVTPAGRKAVEL